MLMKGALEEKVEYQLSKNISIILIYGNQAMMTTEELEQVILDIIFKLYCKKYIGKLVVIELLDSSKEHLGYTLKLELNKRDKPLSISIEGTDQEFLKQITEELRVGRFSSIDYFEAFQL